MSDYLLLIFAIFAAVYYVSLKNRIEKLRQEVLSLCINATIRDVNCIEACPKCGRHHE